MASVNCLLKPDLIKMKTEEFERKLLSSDTRPNLE